MKELTDIVIREWKRIFSKPYIYIVLIVIPPIIFFFYGLIYQKHFAENLPVALWDEDRSELSTKLSNMMHHSKSISINYYINSQEELESLIKKGKIFGAIHFPANMENDVKKNHQTTITLFTNSASLVPSKLIYKDAAGVIIKGGLAVVLEKAKRQGVPAGMAAALVQPIRLNTYTLYNKDFNYQLYLTPGLITVGLQMALVMVAVLMLNVEYRKKQFNKLMSVSKSSSIIVFGKTLAYLTVSWISFVLIAFVVFPIFNLFKAGTILNFFILFNLLVLACIGVGIMISSLFKNYMFATDLGLFYTSPAFVFSGFTFPRWAMPWYDQLIANAMPYTHFMDAFIKIYYMEIPLSYTFNEILSLMLFIGFSYPVAIIVLQIRIDKYNKHRHALVF